VEGGQSVRLFVWRSLHEDDGQDLAEYAFLLAFIAALCILALQQLGTSVNDTYNATSSSLIGSVS
jgi:Flp pilus assembly pilin Flp